MKAFIAVPKITSAETIEAMRRLVEAQGFEAVFAADVEPKNPKGSPKDRTLARFDAVREAMKGADVLVANLTPFIGVEPDPDVTFQLGYMAAQRKPVFSYMNVDAPFYDRVHAWNGADFIEDVQIGESGRPAILKRDRDRMRIENMGIKDRSVALDAPGADNHNNLMLEGPSSKTGSTVLTPAQVQATVPDDQVYTALDVFQHSLQDAKRVVIDEGKTQSAPPPVKEENPVATYLAGPDVFLPELMDHFAAKKRIAGEAGMQGVAPVDAQMDFGEMQTWAMANGNNPRMREIIYESDTGVMQSVRMGLFNLTPFHGTTADSGTIFEAGYLVGKDDALGRKPMIFGYSNRPEMLAEHIAQWNAHPHGPNYGGAEAGGLYDATVYSPMLDGAILASGGSLTHRATAEQARPLARSQQFSALDVFPDVSQEAGKILKVSGINGGAAGQVLGA